MLKTWGNTITRTASRIASAAGRSLQKISQASALVLLGLVSLVTIAQVPPAGTVITNTANATYTANGTPRTGSTNPVSAIVGALPQGVPTLTNSQTLNVLPGATVVFPHTLTNTGSLSDTFTLAVTNLAGTYDLGAIQILPDANGDGVPDSTTPITAPITLGPNQVFRFVVVAVVPPGIASGLTDSLRVSAISATPGRSVAPVTDQAIVAVPVVYVPNLNPSLIKSISASEGNAPSGPYTVTIRFGNTGLAEGIKTNVTISDTLPAGMTYEAGSLQLSIAGDAGAVVTPLPSATGSIPGARQGSYSAASGRVAVTLATMPQNDSGAISFRVNIAPGTPANSVLNNVADITFTNRLGEVVGPILSNPVPFRVLISESITLRGVTLPTAEPGSTVTFDNLLTNNSNKTDTFDITLTDSTFPVGTIIRLFKSDGVTPLTDTNGNVTPDTGPVPVGGTYRIVVKATLPNGAIGGPLSVRKNAQSVTNPRLTASAADVVTVINRTCKVVLEPDNAGTVVAGGSIQYRHTLTNVGNCPETITFPAEFFRNSGNGWTAQVVFDNPSGALSVPGLVDPNDTAITPTTSITLPPGARLVILARVTAPATAAPNSSNTTTITVNGGNSGVLTARDVTTLGGATVVRDSIQGFIDSGFQRPSLSAFIGRDLFIRAEAQSCNAQPDIIERRTIIITGPNGEREEIVAIETGANTGVFEAASLAVRNQAVVPNNNILEGRPFDTYDVEIIDCGRRITTTVTLIDPQGVVFDSRTNQPVSGATVRIVTASGGVCSNTLAAVSALSNGRIVAAPSQIITGTDGKFDFPLVAPGDYCLLVTTPNGYTWVSAVPQSQLPGGRNILATGSYGRPFRVGPETGPVIVDIPVDSAPLSGLFIQKTVLRTVVELGEVTDYTVVVSNNTGSALDRNDVFATDTLPRGFTYVAGSARVDGRSVADPQGGAGPKLVFNLGRMAKDQKIQIIYRVRIGPGAAQGDGVNRVQASYRAGPNSETTLVSESNVATAQVVIVGGVFSDRAYITGKIFADCNKDGLQSDSELGVPGVRLFLEDGTNVISDAEGKYSFYGVSARTHVLKLDRTTLPDGVGVADLVELTNRNLGKPDSRFVDLKSGELQRADFAIATCSPAIKAEIAQRRLMAANQKSEVEGRLQQKLEADPNFRANLDVKALPASGLVGNTVVASTAGLPTGSLLAPAAGATSLATQTGGAGYQTLARPQSDKVTKPILESDGRAPVIDLETLLPDEDNTLGFMGLKEGDTLPYAQTTVRVKGVAGTTFKLTVNGKIIDDSRVGKKAVFADKQSQAWEYFGVNLIQGANTLSVTQLDQFGNARGEKAIKVLAPGDLAKVQVEFLLPKNGAVADGRTPTKVVVRLTDNQDIPVTARVAVTLGATHGIWDVEDLNPVEPGVQVFVSGGRAEYTIMPPTEPVTALVQAAAGAVKGEAKLDFLPDLRELIATGVIEGIINLRKFDANAIKPVRAADAFEQEIRHFSRASSDGKYDGGARAAMFIKGKVAGDYLLTLAYDSDKATRERLFRDIQPDEFYPVYGDSSVRGFDAQSTGRLYVRVDSKKSYLLYGDYNTSQPTEARKLSNYNRSLTGLKQHFETNAFSANVFASRDTTRQVVDEFRGNGTSGPFVLANARGLINSEKLEVLTRSRNQPSLIISAVPLTRFVDYELEPLTGRVLLKSPIASLDENLNPISIRVTYEIDQGGAQFWVAGADAQVRIGENFEVGAMFVDDQNPLDKFRMAGINAVAKLADKTFIIAEIAQTQRNQLGIDKPLGQQRGMAQRIEFKHQGSMWDANLYAGRADAEFDNSTGNLSKGRIEIGGKMSYRLNEKTAIRGELLHSEETVTGAVRDGLLLTVERTLANGLRVEAGLRHARDTVATSPAPGAPVATAGNAVPSEVTSVRLKVTGDVPGLKDASAYGEVEVDVQDISRKIVALGADYRLPNNGRLYGRHEFISSLTGPYGLATGQRQNSTVFGISTDYMKDGNLFSEYRVRDAIAGGDAEAAIGLRNLWTLSEGLKLNTSFERVHSIAGTGNGESTAATFGLEYTANPLWKGSTRLELRNGKTTDSLLSTVAVASKLNRDWTFLGRNTYSLIQNKGSQSGQNEQDRLQLGVAYRDTETNTWDGLARVEHRTETDTTRPEISLKRSVELFSIHANWQPVRPFTFGARYAAKWTSDTSNKLKTNNNAQLLAGRAVWEVLPRWDLSAHGSTVLGNGIQSKQYGLGLELGFMVMENLWLSGGYNFVGYRDEDLTAGEYTSKGAYLRLRYKFDEDLFKASDSAKRANSSLLAPLPPPAENQPAAVVPK